MNTRFQIARVAAFAQRAGICLVALLLCVAAAAAQSAPPSAIGRVEGKDISVDSGIAAANGTERIAPSIYVSNGSIVTVHSGQARMRLFTGGELDICGPAKFTVLVSGSAITLALNFGRVHVELPPTTSLRIFSPTIIATPIGISGGSRDLTVGLDRNDSLCVLAASGAIQLEHQFTGEKLVVPQAGEFFLNEGRLLPVAGTPGTCNCAAMHEPDIPQPPLSIAQFKQAPPPSDAPAPAVAPAPANPQLSESSAVVAVPPPGAKFSVPVPPDSSRPQPDNVAPTIAPTDSSGPKPPRPEVVPALSFMASSPPAPTGPSAETLLMVHEARVSSDWQFTGQVETPEFAAEMQKALGENPFAESQSAQPQNQPAKKHKKHGFWAGLKGLFVGNAEAQEAPPIEPASMR